MGVARHVETVRVRRGSAGSALVLSAALAGCGFDAGALLGGGRTTVSFESNDRPAMYEPVWRTQVYRWIDEHTADVYVSDAAGLAEVLAGGEGVLPESFSVMHVHLFLRPRAGKTPIDFTASNVTITHAVVAGDRVGVYGGAGFLLPDRDPGGAIFAGRVDDATLRPLSSSAGFAERLGWNEASGRVVARRDDEGAARIGRWFAALTGSPALTELD